jgi:hypothetical protein
LFGIYKDLYNFFLGRAEAIEPEGLSSDKSEVSVVGRGRVRFKYHYKITIFMTKQPTLEGFDFYSHNHQPDLNRRSRLLQGRFERGEIDGYVVLRSADGESGDLYVKPIAEESSAEEGSLEEVLGGTPNVGKRALWLCECNNIRTVEELRQYTPEELRKLVSDGPTQAGKGTYDYIEKCLKERGTPLAK